MKFITWNRASLKLQIHPVFMENILKESMSSNIKFYTKDNKLCEIHFSVLIGGLKEVNAPCENLNTSDFNEIKIILLIFTGISIFILECIPIWLLAPGKRPNHTFQVLTDLLNHVSEF